MLDQVQKLLGTLAGVNWASETDAWGERVALYRDYEEGKHRADMTREMKNMLRLKDAPDEQFNDNYCDLVVQEMTDRLHVERVEAVDGSDDAQNWVDEILSYNRWDGLEVDLFDATVRDGDSFVMIAWSNDDKMPVMEFEPAWDGNEGIIPLYDRMQKTMLAAIKIWYEPAANDIDSRRMNIYRPGQVSKYRLSTGGLQEIETVDWKYPNGDALGIPIFHFKNRGKKRRATGVSALAGVIPLQDALNRTMVSMVMTSELSAFPLRKAKGFEPPDNVAPGSWIIFGDNTDDASLLAAMDAGMIPAAPIVPFLDQANWLVDQIGTISRTPLPANLGGDSQSGEALKQRQVGLIGKCRKFAVRNGNVIEDMLSYCRDLQIAFGTAAPPQVRRFDCKWSEFELRNESEAIDNAVKIRDEVGVREFLRLIGRVYGYDEAKIDQIISEKSEDSAAIVSNLNLPGFSEFAL